MIIYLGEAKLKVNVQASQEAKNHPLLQQSRQRCQSTSTTLSQTGKGLTLWLTPSSY